MENKNIFEDRLEASLYLMKVLPIESMRLENWIVIATSTGGLPIAKEIAHKIGAHIDYMFTEKVMAPHNGECEIAIVTEKEEVVIHEELVRSFDINLETIFIKAKERFEKILVPTIRKYRDRPLSNLYEQNVLLVDEGLNTGLTMMACIKTAIKLGAKSVSVATPVIPSATVGDLESIADDLYYYKAINHFVSIDFYYKNLEFIEMNKIETYLKG
ncbi:phosphoribosyltransferase [Arcobacter sp. FWKO B]|uniref:phosphoribosyltransferase n=1 Tax=Arcobacter sp. FWKO B TaxID=2593672 RepID=UPI001D182A7C|nr:phosphoribosyltransferase family protein [Arcobacter sp. FWKO B]